MVSEMFAVLFAINVISAANGFIDPKLGVLEPILKCYEGKAPEFAGMKTMEGHLNLDSDADDFKLSCLAVEVSSQTKLMQDKLSLIISK